MAFRSLASERFWQLYSELPADVQRLADKQYERFREAAKAGARCRVEPAHASVRPGSGRLFRLVDGTFRPPFTRRLRVDLAGGAQSEKPRLASVNQKLSAVRKLAGEAALK